MHKAIEISDQVAAELRAGCPFPHGGFEGFASTVQAEIAAIHPRWQDDEAYRARFVAARAGWRAAIAPIIYEAELELTQNVARRIADQKPLAPLAAQRMPQFDGLLAMYGTFEGRRLAFLRSMSVLGRSAMNHVITAIKHDPDHPLAESAHEFKKAEAAVVPFFRDRNPYPALKDPLERPRQHAVTANVTALNILAAAERHASVWPGDKPVTSRMLDHLEELARPQYTTSALHARHLPNYNNDYSAPEGVFSGSPEDLAKQGIRALPSLQRHWPNKHWCPANISFEDENDELVATAATMRMETAIKVADGILWEASGLYGEVQVAKDIQMQLRR